MHSQRSPATGRHHLPLGLYSKKFSPKNRMWKKPPRKHDLRVDTLAMAEASSACISARGEGLAQSSWTPSISAIALSSTWLRRCSSVSGRTPHPVLTCNQEQLPQPKGQVLLKAEPLISTRLRCYPCVSGKTFRRFPDSTLPRDSASKGPM